MRDELAHRGPDHAGFWSSEDGRVCLGHRRLAIVDLTADANQPFVAGDARYVITFNGEIYNFVALRRELAGHGVHFRTRSDTELLLEAFRFWGEDCLNRLSGMFAFAIWDSVDRVLFCARDRAGEKPFYYAPSPTRFLFGSELKAIACWPDFNRRLSCEALIDYLSFGFVPDPRTIWEDCRKLPPGHCLWVRVGHGGRPVVDSPVAWWDMQFRPDTSVRDWGPVIRDCLTSAASEMTVADVPVGTFLSGGVDSSSVTAALARTGKSVRTFTVGFHEAGLRAPMGIRGFKALQHVPHRSHDRAGRSGCRHAADAVALR